MKYFPIKLILLLFCGVYFNILAVASDIDAAFDLDAESVSSQVSRSQVYVRKIAPAKSSVPLGVFDEYRLGAGDKIKIHVFKQPDMDVEMRLGATGNVRFPFLGKLHVIGMTMPGLERKITYGLSQGYLVNPQVRVSMEEFRPFYVNGEVKNPGSYPYQPALTVRKAVSLAGGFTIDADKNKVFLIHAADDQKNESHVSLRQAMDPGDILTIKKSFFFVNGEVKNPGKYSYQVGITYRMAIAIAGGLKEKSDDNKVYVVHESEDRQTYHVDTIDAEIKAGDVITAKEGFF